MSFQQIARSSRRYRVRIPRLHEIKAALRVLLCSTLICRMLPAFAALLGDVFIGAASAQQLPLDYFIKHRDFDQVKISPNGKTLAATVMQDGQLMLGFVDLEKNELTFKVAPRDRADIFQYYWVTDERVVYSVAERRGTLIERPVPTGELYAVNLDSSRHELIYGYRAGAGQTGTRIQQTRSTYASHEILSRLRDNKREILIAEYPWRRQGRGFVLNENAKPEVYRLDVYNGDKHKVIDAPAPRASLLVDRDNAIRFATAYESEYVLNVYHRDTDDVEWRSFEIEGLEQGTVEPLAFSADNEFVYLQGVGTDRSVSSLFRLSTETEELEELYRHERVDVGPLLRDLSRQTIIGAMLEPATLEYFYIDPEHQGVRFHRALRRAFPGRDVRITSATRDGTLAVVRVASDIEPAAFYLFDVEEMKAQFLLSVRSWVDSGQQRPMKPVSITARDNVELHGYLTQPTGDGPHPMIILPHGGPHFVRDHWRYNWEIQLLANRGYAVLQVNFRGSGGYGRDFLEAGFGEWGAAMQDDITDATQWAIDEGHARTDGICIYGASYGAYAALMGVIREPGLYQCAAGYAGVYDLPLMFEEGDIPEDEVGLEYLKKVLGTDPDKQRRRSPVHNTDKVRVPVFIAHGGADARAPIAHAERLREALEAHNKPFEWLVFSNEGHGFYDLDHRREYYGKLLKFFNRHLAD